VAAGHEQRALDSCHARLRRTVEVRVEDRDPKPSRAQSIGQVHRQRALTDAALARADGDEMPHPGKAVGDATALLGDLFEDSGPSVADDVVVALHLGEVAYTRLPLGRGVG